MKAFLLVCASVFLITMSGMTYSQIDQDERNLPIFTTGCKVKVFTGAGKELFLTENPPTCVEVVQLAKCGETGSGGLAGAMIDCQKTGEPAEVSQVTVTFEQDNISALEASTKLNTLQVADE